jgi:hypothetical protein
MFKIEKVSKQFKLKFKANETHFSSISVICWNKVFKNNLEKELDNDGLNQCYRACTINIFMNVTYSVS